MEPIVKVEPEPLDLAEESFDTELRIVSMPIEKLERLEEEGKVKETRGYRNGGDNGDL